VLLNKEADTTLLHSPPAKHQMQAVNARAS